MTIGIGVLCSSRPGPYEPKPDSFVMVADTMGSTDTDSVDELHKMYVDEESRICITCSGAGGAVEKAAELVPQFIRGIKALPLREHGPIWAVLNQVLHDHKQQHFHWDVVAPRFAMLTNAGVPDSQAKEEWLRRIQEAWDEYDIGVQLIVGTFTASGQALLYQIAQAYDELGRKTGSVHPMLFPGYTTIGSGSDNASFWLNYRGQHLGLNIKQSAYHAFEAELMAARSPTVNHKIDVVVAMPDKTFTLTTQKPSADGCPVSLTELKQMFPQYGPQDTRPIGHPVAKPAEQ